MYRSIYRCVAGAVIALMTTVCLFTSVATADDHQMMVFRGGGRLFLVDTKTHQLSSLTFDGNATNFSDWSPHWSWSLDKIVFVSDRSGHPELWMIAPDGSGLRQLTNFQDQDGDDIITGMENPVWDPVGSRIAF